jgi:hypothetical protein
MPDNPKATITQSPDKKFITTKFETGDKEIDKAIAAYFGKSHDFKNKMVANSEYIPEEIKTQRLTQENYTEIYAHLIFNSMEHAKKDTLILSLMKDIGKPKSYTLKGLKKWHKDNAFAIKGRFNMYSSKLLWFLVFTGLSYWLTTQPVEYLKGFNLNKDFIGFLRFLIVALVGIVGTSFCSFSKQDWKKIKQLED